jgi:hypothetical protein
MLSNSGHGEIAMKDLLQTAMAIVKDGDKWHFIREIVAKKGGH